MDRRAFILSIAALGACQMEPVLAPYQGQQLVMKLPEPRNRYNFLLNRSLLERVKHDSASPLELKYSISQARRSVGTRDQIHATATYTLTDTSDPKNPIVKSDGKVQALVSFRDAGGTLTELVSENDGYVRFTAILADRMVDKITRDLRP